MAVPDQDPISTHVASGASGVFAYGFYLLDEDDLRVTADAVELVLDADYTVSGVGTPSGGTVTISPTPAAGVVVTLYRDTVPAREEDYQTAGDLPAASLDYDFDRLWMAMQESLSGGKVSARALRVPAGETVSALPPAADRALRIIGFDAAGDVSLNVPASGSATDLALLLASSTVASEGAGMIGFDDSLSYAAGTVGAAIQDLDIPSGGIGTLVTTYGADPTGVADSTMAFINCIAANALTLVPPGTYKLTGNIPVPASRFIRGAGIGITILSKETTSDLFLLNGWYFGIEDISWLVNGDTYATGSVFVPALNTNYHFFNRCFFRDYKAPVWEATAAEAGKQSRFTHCEFKPVASATFTAAIKLSPIQDVGAGNRRIIDCNGQGGMLVDLGGSLETFMTNSFTNGIGNDSTLADIFYITNCRNALVGTAQYLKGQGANIIGNQLPGPVILRNSGTNSITYSDNKEHSLSWGNGKYNNISMQAPYRWTQNAGGSASAVSAPGVTMGSVSLPVADGSIFQIGQYIEVQSGTYWRSVVDGIETTTSPHMLTLRTPAPQGYAAGSVIARFQHLLCDANISTTCTQATPGLYTVVVASATSLVPGQSVLVQNAGRSSDSIRTTITAISGTTVTLADPIESAIAGVAFIAQGAPIEPGTTGGSLTMIVDRRGKRVSVSGRMVVGSGTVNLGSGNWTLWLPALSDPALLQPIYASAYDTSASTDYQLRGTMGTSECWVTFTRNGTVVRNNHPMTWAAGDVFDFNFEYEAW